MSTITKEQKEKPSFLARHPNFVRIGVFAISSGLLMELGQFRIEFGLGTLAQVGAGVLIAGVSIAASQSSENGISKVTTEIENSLKETTFELKNNAEKVLEKLRTTLHLNDNNPKLKM
jgi:hypothetical protein